ncbi:MAG: MBL fold metallo-hydrolase [Rhodobacterales bacterium]|nr:MBL fold metallo-hydrolase [Rhodobacterales bacterium]
MGELRFTILGCGSSGGVPRLGGHWGNCDPNNVKNFRKRCSLLIQRFDNDNVTNVLIDTTPDMRQQLLDAKIGKLDAVIYTHEHADHLHGLDDLRMIVINMQKRLPVFASKQTKNSILERFGYAFKTPKGSPYPPILDMNDLIGTLEIQGAGGPITFTSFDVDHGNILVSAIKVNDVLYTPDISTVRNDNELRDLDYWILDSLRYKPHPSHVNLEQALGLIDRYKPKKAILTNLHVDLDYSTLLNETPENVVPAHDGLQIKLKV